MDYEAIRNQMLAEAEALINKGDFEAFAAKKKEIEELDNQHRQQLEAAASLKALRAENAPAKLENSAVKIENAVKADSVKLANGIAADLMAPTGAEKFTNTTEYRLAFMDYVCNGTKMPAKFQNTDATTVTGDVGVMIPDTVLLPIIQKLETSGRLYALMRKTNIKGGVKVPVSSVRPVATWLAERGDSDNQKKTVTSISFGYYKLKCKIAVSFEVSVVTLPAFESTFINEAYTAMIKAIEKSAVIGNGSTGNQLTGVLNSAAPTGQNIDIAYNASITLADVIAAEAALPEEYDDDKCVWCMTKGTFYNYFKTITTTTGQPIAESLGGNDNKIKPILFGRRVVFLDKDIIPDYAATVDADTIFAFIFNWDYYLLNTNQQAIMKEYTDEDTDDLVRKVLMLVDGKPVDNNSLVTMTKKKQ